MRLAFIGGFGHHYLRPLAKENSLQIDRPIAVARCTPDDSGAERLKDALGDVEFYDDPIAMLDDYKPDVVSVGAIYGHNGLFIAAALERGIDVVSDKPIASTWEQLDRIRELVQASKRTVLTEFDFRSRKEFRAARELVRGGQIGEPVLATAQKSYRFGTRPSWYADRALYSGTMLWIASHAIDAIRFTTGKTLRALSGRGGNISQPAFGSMEDHVTALFELEGGGTGIVHADFLRPPAAPTHGDDRLRLAGTKGVLEIRDRRCTFIGPAGETDVTDSAATQPMHLELLAALKGESRDLYSTEASLELAAVLLAARDAADGFTKD